MASIPENEWINCSSQRLAWPYTTSHQESKLTQKDTISYNNITGSFYENISVIT